MACDGRSRPDLAPARLRGVRVSLLGEVRNQKRLHAALDAHQCTNAATGLLPTAVQRHIMQSSALLSALKRGSILVGSTKSESQSDLRGILLSRLAQYFEVSGKECPDNIGVTLEAAQLMTSQEALQVIQDVQALLNAATLRSADQPSRLRPSESTSSEELLGKRDLSQLRILLSLIFKWSIYPFMARVSASIPNITPGGRRRTDVNIIDLTSLPEDYKILHSTLLKTMAVLLPSGTQGPLSPTHVTSAILDTHLVDLLHPCIVLGWLPKSLSSESVLPVDELRPSVIHLINMSVINGSLLECL